MPWLAFAYLLAAFVMMVTGLGLMLDAGIQLARNLRRRDRG